MKTIKLFALGVASVALLGITGSAQAAMTAYYSLNGNTNDSSGNGYNGTVNGGPAVYGTGKGQAQAFSFNGGTNIATTSADNLGLINHSFTVDAWVNFATPTGGDLAVFGTNASGNQDQGLHLIERGDVPFMGFYSDDLQGSTPLVANTWYNIAWVYNSTGSNGTQSIYVNGKLDATRTTVGNLDATGETAFIGNSCCAGEMNGLIQDVAVFNTALSQAEVSEFLPEPSSVVGLVGLCGMGLIGVVVRRRKAGSPARFGLRIVSQFLSKERTTKAIALGVASVALLGITGSARAALVAYYSLNGNTNDSSGNGYNGTVNGNTNYAAGKGQAQAFSFDGSTSIATTSTDNLGLVNHSFTVDAWVNFSNPTSTAGNGTAVFGTNGPGIGDQDLHLIDRGDVALMGFYGDDLTGNTTFAANTWYNIAWVFNSTGSNGTQSIYINGQLDAQRISGGNFSGAGLLASIGGGVCCSDQMNGLIQDVAIYNTALSQAEVSEFLPEPSSVVALVGLCGMGLVGFVIRRRRKS